MKQSDEFTKGVFKDPDSTERKIYKKPELTSYANLKEITGVLVPTNE
jgi:hypothetical protein